MECSEGLGINKDQWR